MTPVAGATALGLTNKAWASGVAIALALAACGPRVKTDTLSNDRAAALCAAMDTAAEIKNLVFEQAEKQTAASNRLALTQLAKQANLRIEAPLLDSYDDDSRKTTCSGELHLALPAGAVRNLGDTSDLTASVKYSAQPTPDHLGMSYQVTGADVLISGVAGADITDWASKLQPNGMPAEGAPVPVGAPAPESAAPPQPVAGVTPVPAIQVPTASIPLQAGGPTPRPTVTAKRAQPIAGPPSPAYAGLGPPLLPRCRWAHSYADRTICGDPSLEAEDRRIAALYRAALAQDDTGEVRRVAQSERAARQGCQDRDCILEWFRQREADLSQR